MCRFSRTFVNKAKFDAFPRAPPDHWTVDPCGMGLRQRVCGVRGRSTCCEGHLPGISVIPGMGTTSIPGDLFY